MKNINVSWSGLCLWGPHGIPCVDDEDRVVDYIFNLSEFLPPLPSPEQAAISCDAQDKEGCIPPECNGTWKYTENGLAAPIDTPLPYIPPPEN